jgi:uncharacterized protein
VRIDLSPIQDQKGATIDVERVERFDPIDLGRSALAFPEPVRFVGKATNTGDGIILSGTAWASTRAVCDRCLTEFDMKVEVPIFETYYRAGTAAARQDEDGRTYHGDEVDITPAIEAAIVLSLPIRIICREDCRGLCTDCGANLNEGPCSCGRRT